MLDDFGPWTLDSAPPFDHLWQPPHHLWQPPVLAVRDFYSPHASNGSNRQILQEKLLGIVVHLRTCGFFLFNCRT